eukprot:TRINITY_DN38166_c0_g1_i1.p1 TRINITY_DN38166_c0_g1~~TRINITY_DN38166_c0_g1_i1.p1  ORF type:complete len:759 (-),score=86.16 TRINITY_DN38166_c0_g1_i1:155-2431(-)
MSDDLPASLKRPQSSQDRRLRRGASIFIRPSAHNKQGLQGCTEIADVDFSAASRAFGPTQTTINAKEKRLSVGFDMSDMTFQRSLSPTLGEKLEDSADLSARASLLLVEEGDEPVSTSLGFGKCYRMSLMSDTEQVTMQAELELHQQHKIGELPATAICGNDITASCFYVVGELTKNAGVYAPICTLLSALTLFCFRSIYGECVTSLPLNGGIYNLLLNSSTKRTASVAACLTILSYTATGVVSAVSAADYLSASTFVSDVPVVHTAVGILGFFAVLMLLGMKESSVVATALFVFHLLTLTAVVVASAHYLLVHGLDQFWKNWNWPEQPPIGESIYFGFASAMLGVSGFETSANFVEEQQPGVFVKTLTNMWASVSIINFVVPVISVAIIPMENLTGDESAFAIAFLADKTCGTILRNIVAVDALLVLSGSVLTSYVGVCGLIQRMSGDRCLPELFAATNSWRGTLHWTILVFFGVCSSMCIVLKGDITMLGAIYSIAFLLVMGLFAFCGLWMKVKRPTLPRPVNTHPIFFVLGLTFVSCALSAVVSLHADMLNYFYFYYGCAVAIVMVAFTRISIFTSFLWMLSNSCVATTCLSCICCINKEQAADWTLNELERLWNQGVVYFTKRADISQLNRAMQYIEQNEEARCVRLVHVYPPEEEEPYHLLECAHLLDLVYPAVRVDCILIPGEFGPVLVRHVARSLGVSLNSMFMNCPKAAFRYDQGEMGGVRVILNSEKRSMLEMVKPRVTKKSLRGHEKL